MSAFLVSVALVLGLVAGSVATASADAGLAGRWMSDSLRDNGIGYYMVLRPVSERNYVGHLRFQYRDGRRNAPMPISVIVTGADAVLMARHGSFDKAGRTLRARVGPTGVVTLTNCLERLSLVMSWDLDSDCTLRLQP